MTARGWLVAGIPVLLLAVLRPGVASAATLTRGPYLQLVTGDSATIVWRTDRATACSVAIRPLGGTTTIVPGGTGAECAVAASGLAAGTVYSYQPLGDGLALDGEATFRTDDPDLPFAFHVLGDSGGGNPEQYAVRDRMLEHAADLIVHTGDMVYDDGEAAHFDPKFFTPYAPLLRNMVLWPCLGNHDVRSKNGQAWVDAFFTPANNAAGSERYYSFDYGNAHFVVLNTTSCTDPGCAQHTFLEEDLANTDAVWKFVFFHHTIYSAGSHGSATRIRDDVVPIFDAHGVDVVFMGHEHDYERTFSMRDDGIVGPGQGTVYITTGGGGRTLRPVGSEWFTAYAESAHHFVRVRVDGNVLAADMVRVDGAIRDSLTIVKEPLRCGDGLVNQSTEQCDGVRDDACPGACRADCTCPPVCGDGHVNQPDEECDVPADAACPLLCRGDCRCGVPPPELELAPIADTHVDREIGADWDHGAADRLHIDASPGAVGYLKFDLRAAVVPVRAATLSLHCVNTSNSGGTIHPVLDSTWVEGSGLGNSAASEEGSGLKWTDVDTNRDGTINARDDSPYVPDLAQSIAAVGPVRSGQTVMLDVTSALQDGPGIYTFAIVGKSADGVEYATREHPDERLRPVLRVELEIPCSDDADCDDGVFCNGAEVCTSEGCRIGAVRPNGTPCADANVCNGLERCEDGMCTAGVPLECDDGAACTVDSCSAALGCRHVLLADGTACPDASVCNGGETCQAGVCTAGAPLDCDDGNVCTRDGCHPVAGCHRVSVADGTVCRDETVCNGSEVCQAGGCTAGPPLDCDDGNPCTTDSCDPVAGCRHAYVSGRCGPVVREPIADTYIEAGAQSSWDHGAADHLDVDDRPRDVAYLKFDLRDVTAPVEEATLTLRCVNLANSGGVFYPVLDSSWVEGTRTGVDGASGAGPGLKWSTVDTNGDGRVSPADSSPYVPDFTQRLAALGAVRIGQSVSVDLTPAFQSGAGLYTIAIVGEVEDGSGFASREAPANDRPRLQLKLASSLPCTADAECDDGLVCTTDTCRPVAGCQHAPAPDGSTCTDGDACNGAETCQAGACAAGIPLDCADGNACTTDGCDALVGCRHLAVPDGTACADATVCNGRETCAAGVCAPGAALDCDDGNPCTTDACDAVAGCQRLSVADGTSCADGDVCNGDEVCQGGECTGGPPRSCDDGDACTSDACDASAGCRYDFVCDSITLGPVADTYIEEGVEATWDHGASGHMDSDLRPRGIIYLKFDLSAIAAPIASAALRLHCTNASPDGGTVYPVARSTWLEGTGNGIDASSRSGNGLKWMDVDTNVDRKVDGADASPYVPDFSQPIVSLGGVASTAQITVDVTAAFQSGPGVYTLAIRSDLSDGVTFASREHLNPIRRPALTLTFSRP